MLRKLRRWVTLAPADRTAVIEAWLLLAAAKLSLRRLDLGRCQRLLAALPPRSRPAEEPIERLAARLRGWIGAAANNHLSSSRCLERALVLRAMLVRRGHQATLRIGVRRPGTGLEAHAWVEWDGVAVVDGELESGGYRTLLPAASGR